MTYSFKSGIIRIIKCLTILHLFERIRVLKEITKKLLSDILRPIPINAHKGSNGTLTVISGSAAYRGAPSLAVGAALRTGCGITRLISIEKIISSVQLQHPCCTFLPVSESSNGTIGADCASAIYSCAGKTDAFLIGCGLGQSAEVSSAVSAVAVCGKKAVLDADALNIISQNPSIYSAFKNGFIVTPHVGEMSRLTGASIPEIKNDLPKYAKAFSLEHRCVTVLKDSVTVISTEAGEIYRSSLGNEGLSKGGSGDVLAGLIAGFAAQDYSLSEAAIIGCAVHGLSANLCAEENGKMAMLPSDLEKYTVKLLASLGF